MAASNPVIRLVGGPRTLDGSVLDLSLSDHDRADAQPDRFVRAVRGSTSVALAALQPRCADRSTTEQLARSWRVVVFTPGRDRRRRARLYRYEGTYALEPVRDELGRWTLAVGSRITGRPTADDEPVPTVWTVLEQLVDEASGRFDRVASLLPDGPLAERAASTRRAVATCLADASRLCQVGATVAPTWQPGDAGDRAASLANRVAALAGTIDEATADIVDLHLEIGDAPDPAEPLAHLADAWCELDP